MLFSELLEACEGCTENKREALELVKDIIEDIKDNADKYLRQLENEVEDCNLCTECFGELKEITCIGESLDVHGRMSIRVDYILTCENCGKEY